MNKSIISLLIIFLFIGCGQKVKLKQVQPDQFYQLISVEETKKLLADSIEYLTVIDVRTPEETAEGVIANAITVDVEAEDFEEKVAKMDKEKTYLVYCRSGQRSLDATTIMRNMGYKKIYEIDGGYLEWTGENED